MHLLPLHLDLGLVKHTKVLCCSVLLQTCLPLVCAKFDKLCEKLSDEVTTLLNDFVPA